MAVSALGRQEVYAAQIDGDVVIGPLRLVNPRVTFSGTGAKANIGYGILRKLTLVIDPAGQRSWVLDPHRGMASFADYAGRYGPRAIRVENGNLVHQRDGRPAYILTPIGSDLFEIAETGDRIQFYRTNGRPERLDLITVEGHVAPAERTN